jgi:hypothetical protein
MNKNDDIAFFISRIIANAADFHVRIEGDPNNKWFVLKDAPLAPLFSTTKCDIMVKVDTAGKVAVLVPEHIKINFHIEPCICPLFLTEHTYIQGWRRVCPCLTERSLEPNFENIEVILQFVQNPILCGIHGCDLRVCYFKQMGDLCWELPWETKEDFDYEDDVEKQDKEQ